MKGMGDARDGPNQDFTRLDIAVSKVVEELAALADRNLARQLCWIVQIDIEQAHGKNEQERLREQKPKTPRAERAFEHVTLAFKRPPLPQRGNGSGGSYPAGPGGNRKPRLGSETVTARELEIVLAVVSELLSQLAGRGLLDAEAIEHILAAARGTMGFTVRPPSGSNGQRTRPPRR